MGDRRKSHQQRLIKSFRFVLGIMVAFACLAVFMVAIGSIQSVTYTADSRIEESDNAQVEPDAQTTVDEAMSNSPDRSIDVRLAVHEQPSTADSVILVTTLEVSGANSVPVLKLLASGIAAKGDDVNPIIDLITGSVHFWEGPFEWGAPSVSQSATTISVRTTSTDTVARNQLTQLSYVPPYWCGKIKSSELLVVVSDLTLSAIRTEPSDHARSEPACSTGYWNSVSRNEAVFTGTSQAAVLGIGRQSSSTSTGNNSFRQPGIDLSTYVSNFVYLVFTTVPFFLIWMRFRHRSTQLGSILGFILALHIIANLDVIISLFTLATSLLIQQQLPGAFYAFGATDLILLLTAGIVWPTLVRRQLWQTARPQKLRAILKVVLLALAIVAVVCAAETMKLWGSMPPPTSPAEAVRLALEGNAVGFPASRPWWSTEPFVLLSATVVALGLAPAAAALLVPGRRRLYARMALLALAAGFLFAAYDAVASSDVIDAAFTPQLAQVVQLAPSLVAGMLVWSVTLSLLGAGVGVDPPSQWENVRRHLSSWTLPRLGLALILAVPIIVISSSSPASLSHYQAGGWSEFAYLLVSIDACLRLVVVAVLVVALRTQAHRPATYPVGSDYEVSAGTINRLREIAVLISLIGLFDATRTINHVPVSFLAGWLLVETVLWPRSQANRALAVGPAARRAARAALAALMSASLRHDALLAAAKANRKALSEAEPDGSKLRSRVQYAIKLGSTPNVDPRLAARAFSTQLGSTPWARARTFGIAGFIIGLPWTMVDFASALSSLSGSLDHYPITRLVASSLLVLRFSLAGLLFGATFPAIRGNGGLAKGFSLFVTLAIPAVCITFLPEPSRATAFAALFQVTQLFSFAVPLGLFADLKTFKMNRMGWRHLREHYRLGGLAVSLSSIVLAVVTASATAFGTGAVAVIVNAVLTPKIPSPVVQPTQGPTPGVVRTR